MAKQKGYFKAISHYRNCNIGLHPNPSPNPKLNASPNPSFPERKIRFTARSRDQNRFLSITTQRSIFRFIVRYVG